MKRISWGGVILIILLLTGCSDQKIQANESPSETEKTAPTAVSREDSTVEEAAPAPRELPPEFIQITSGGLRMRSEFGLKGTVLRHLPAGAVLRVLEQSRKKEDIDGMSAYWYKVTSLREYGLEGWIYGGYTAPWNPNPDTPTTIRDTIVLDPEGFPDLKMKIYGFDPPSPVPKGPDEIIFDSMNDSLLLFWPDDMEPHEILVEAEDPEGRIFRQYLGSDHTRSFGFRREDYETGEQFPAPCLDFTFHNSAAFPAGVWHFRISQGDRLIGEYEKDIRPDKFSFSSLKDPDPFYFSSWGVVKPGESLYLYGRLDPSDEPVNLVIYNRTNEQNDDLSFLLKPLLATRVIPEGDGRFNLEIHMGSDIPAGEYKLAYGSDELNLMELNLGFTYLPEDQ